MFGQSPAIAYKAQSKINGIGLPQHTAIDANRNNSDRTQKSVGSNRVQVQNHDVTMGGRVQELNTLKLKSHCSIGLYIAARK